MENFEIRTYGRTELALCYFPDLNPQVAYRKLQYWIDYYPHLREELEEDGQWLELPYLYAGSGTADCGGDRGALKGDCDGVRPDKKNSFPDCVIDMASERPAPVDSRIERLARLIYVNENDTNDANQRYKPNLRHSCHSHSG